MVNWYSTIMDITTQNSFLLLDIGFRKRNLGNKTPTLDKVKGKLVGETIPDFTAQKSVWQYIFSVSGKKKTVLVFIRGQWCPYCNKYVESLQNIVLN